MYLRLVYETNMVLSVECLDTLRAACEVSCYRDRAANFCLRFIHVSLDILVMYKHIVLFRQ